MRRKRKTPTPTPMPTATGTGVDLCELVWEELWDPEGLEVLVAAAVLLGRVVVDFGVVLPAMATTVGTPRFVFWTLLSPQQLSSREQQ
jgi:hypothetical protein